MFLFAHKPLVGNKEWNNEDTSTVKLYAVKEKKLRLGCLQSHPVTTGPSLGEWLTGVVVMISVVTTKIVDMTSRTMYGPSVGGGGISYKASETSD